MNKILSFKKLFPSVFCGVSGCFFVGGNGAGEFFDLFKSSGNNTAAVTSSKTYTLKTNKSGKGAVTSNDGKINCGSDCSEKYNSSPVATVTLMAAPSSGYSFSKWSGGGCGGSGDCTVKMTKSITVTANFKKVKTTSGPQRTEGGSSSSVSASVSQTAVTGSATNITSASATLNGVVNPEGLKDVTYKFEYNMKEQGGQWISTPMQSAGSGSSDVSVMADISGLSSGRTYVYHIMAVNNAATDTTNIFEFIATGEDKFFTTLSAGGSSSSSSSLSSSPVSQQTLKVAVSGDGKVISNPSGISCKKSSGSCEAKFNQKDSVTLTASTPVGGSYSFGVWGKDCANAGKSPSCVVIMGSDKKVSATFNSTIKTNNKTVNVSVRKSGTGKGRIVSISSGKEDKRINCRE